MTAGAATVSNAIDEFLKLLHWQLLDREARFHAQKERSGISAADLGCVDCLFDFGESIRRYERSPNSFRFSEVLSKLAPDLERPFLQQMRSLPFPDDKVMPFLHPLRFRLACYALAYANAFQQWRSLDKYRRWDRRYCHVLPHVPAKERCPQCRALKLPVFAVNSPADQSARRALTAAGNEFFWLIRGAGKAVLAKAALCAPGNIAAAALSGAVEAVRNKIEGGCIGVVIEGPWLNLRSSGYTIYQVEGESLGLPVLAALIGDVLLKSQSGVPLAWRANIVGGRSKMASGSTGVLAKGHDVGWVYAIGMKRRAAAARQFWFPAANDNDISGPMNTPGAVRNVSDVIRLIMGYDGWAVTRRVALAAAIGAGLPASMLTAKSISDLMNVAPALSTVRTSALGEYVRLDLAESIVVNSSPAVVLWEASDRANDGATSLRFRSQPNSRGKTVTFRDDTGELKDEAEVSLVQGGAQITIEFPPDELLTIEVGLWRHGKSIGQPKTLRVEVRR